MHRKVVRLIALYQILRLFLRSVNCVAFERNFGDMLFLDRPPDTSGFRVPFNVISYFKIVCHWFYLPLQDTALHSLLRRFMNGAGL